AEFISRYFNKGSMIAIEGTLRTGSYQDKNHPDVTHYITDVLVENVEFTGSKSENTTNSQAQSVVQKAGSLGIPSDFEELISDEEVPF
ncbi:MAG: single-stranded DNA-binding protein, partial [Ruminococcus sp.]|nr:single-stranded DNA-binding protein [Ruminococcus sp.]